MAPSYPTFYGLVDDYNRRLLGFPEADILGQIGIDRVISDI